MKFDEADLKTIFAHAQAALIGDRAFNDGLETTTEESAVLVDWIFTEIGVLINIDQRWGLYDSAGKPSLANILSNFKTAAEAVEGLDNVTGRHLGEVAAAAADLQSGAARQKAERHIHDVLAVEQAVVDYLRSRSP
ncbi:MAG TPA: hypothetical protein VIG74_06810 [Alphaproteobacteria bacterium]|jgi:hypothetical protein